MSIKNIKLGNNIGMHSIFYHLEELWKWKNGEYFAPLFVDISPTSKCNHNCFFCFVEWTRTKPKSIPEELLVNIFIDLAKAGVKACEVQGNGEPFLNPALPEAIVKGHEAGLNVCVVTNGTLLAKQTLNKIMPHLSFLRVSNLEKSADIYSKTHGCSEKHFRKVLKALENAVNIRDGQGLDTVVTATAIMFDYNLPFLVETVRMLKDIGVDIVHVKSPGIMQHNKAHCWDTSVYARYKDTFDEAKNLQNDHFKVNIRDDYFRFHDKEEKKNKKYKKCYGVEFAIHMSSDAKLYPCYTYWDNDRYCLGDLKEKSFAEIWNSDRRRDTMKRFFEEVDNQKCDFFCKQNTPNEVLWELKNPPLHSGTF